MKPLNNLVLLKQHHDNSKVRLEGGQIIWLDTSYEAIKFSTVVCEVVAVPDRLVFGARKPNSMDWKTEMLLRPGDIVTIHYMGYQKAFGEDVKHFTEDGVEYFFCDYGMIYCAKRRWKPNEEEGFFRMNNAINDSHKPIWEGNSMVVDVEKREVYNVIMLNGYVLVQPIEKEYKTSLHLPEYLKKQPSKRKVRVCYSGEPNQAYLNDAYQDSRVYPHDEVMVARTTDIPLEYVPTFNGKETYWRVQACLIEAVLGKEVEVA